MLNRTRTTADGWELSESGPPDAARTALLLPGALAGAAFYDDLAAEPALRGLHLVATTLPGYAGTPAPEDLSIETCAAQAGRLAGLVAADVVVGHSVGANVAIEMVAAREFSGPVVLLAPSFSRRDESRVPRALDRLASVFGHLPFALVLAMGGGILKGEVPEHRLAPLTAEIRRNDPRVVRRALRQYLRHLDAHGSVAPRLCDSGVRAWVVFGTDDAVGLSAGERRTLDACPRVTHVSIPGAGHFTLNTHPARIAGLVLEALSARAA
ncbi:alpha/beta fold hydrolase [Kitasatospora sp. NPDC050543]|uniref:alpha/beta fold hydrolase n=1 Tax=Kitasatospora sp. NPDC050543 TaxID=3364054 RepID=UPI0037A4C347